ncbi:hypothetical protein GQ53DRAFT_797019 [Thozetella sp. PMI_491]|nr:hypothetical protein GQ53DRAFT_797019 [Thozetella sp. PMI_491]
MQACDRCHARKTRCDRRIPQCSACEKAGVACLHADKLRQRYLPRGYIDSMETMVRQLKQENESLRNSLTAAEAAAKQAESVASRTPEAATAAGTARAPSYTEHMEHMGQPSDSPASSRTSSGADDVVTLEVGYLSLIATGETRYLGSSSGMGLASIVSTVVGPQAGVPLISTDSVTSDSHGPRPVAQLGPEHASFPSRAKAMPCIETYFTHTHITFPLLHRPSFLATVERIYGEPGYYEANPFDAFAFDMVLAIGSSNFNRFGDSSVGSSAFYAAAQVKLGKVMEISGLAALKAILLISQHGIFSNLCDTSASIWHLVGIGVRICLELGLHLEHKAVSGGPATYGRHNVTVTLEEEMRRRCFWCLYNLDRIICVTLGRPVAIRDEEIDIPLPSHLDDDFFSPDRPTTWDLESQPGSTPPVSPFLHLIKIRRISGQILNLFYNSRHHSGVPIEEKRQMRRNFYQQICSWKEETQQLELSHSPEQGTYVSCFISQEWYTAVFSNAILLLYRPSPYLPHPTMAIDLEDGEGDLIRLLTAAKEGISSYSKLHQRRRLNYSWITLHGVFISGLAYVYSVGRILRDPASRGHVPDLLSIVDTTRECSNVLVAICERWNASRRSCELFNKLSNAVIQDALNVASRPTANPAGQQAFHSASSGRANGDSSTIEANAQDQRPYDPLDESELMEPMSQLEEILVADEFRQFATSFDLTGLRESSVPSEVISGFSYTWSFDSPFQGVDEFEGSAPTHSGW